MPPVAATPASLGGNIGMAGLDSDGRASCRDERRRDSDVDRKRAADKILGNQAIADPDANARWPRKRLGSSGERQPQRAPAGDGDEVGPRTRPPPVDASNRV